MMPPQYNLLDEPWLPVRLRAGGVQSLGLLDVFRRSGEISALAETAPPSLVAEYRMLLAIVHRALVRAFGNWTDRDRVTWFREGLPAGALCDYLETWRERFWLFDDQHPFMQVAILATAEETRDKHKPWTQVSLASANGNAPVVFDHALDAAPAAIAWPMALAHLLGFMQFTPGGLVKTVRDADKAGALVNTAAVLPIGRTLSETLCLALHRPPLPSQAEPDLPAWERAPLTLADLRADPALATGPNDRYTRQSRAVLLQAEQDGRVRWLRFAAGHALAEDEQRPDPMACYRAGSDKLVRVTFTAGRAAWRDLPALLPAPQAGQQASFRAAEVMESAAALHALMGRRRQHQPLLVAGLASDQAKLLRWRVEQFSLPQPLLSVPDCARELRAHLALAEDLSRQVRTLAVELVAGALPDPRSRDTVARARDLVDRSAFTALYFAAAERQLPELMERIAAGEPDAADALWHTCLRDAAQAAWDGVLKAQGLSARVLMSEARNAGRMLAVLRKHLPKAFAPARASATEAAVHQPEGA